MLNSLPSADGDGIEIHELCCSVYSNDQITVEQFNYYIRTLRPLNPNEVTARVAIQLKGSISSWMVFSFFLASCSSVYMHTIKPYRTHT
jgi:hypothetical protein